MNLNLPSDLQRLAPFIAVAVLAVAGLVVVTRGLGGGDGGTANAAQVVNKAFSDSPKTAVLDLRAVVTAEVAGAPQAGRSATLNFTGPFEEATDSSKEDKADVRIAETGDGRDVSLRYVSTGDRGYMRAAGRWYQLTPAQFAKMNEEEEGSGSTFASELGFDLQKWMRNPRITGSARVNGVETYQITADLDAAAMAADFEEQDSGGSAADDGFDTFLQDAQKGGTVNLFIGKQDGVLRKADITASYTGQASAQATMRITFRFDLGVRDVNKPQNFTAPESALPGSRLAALDPALLGSQADDLGLTKGSSSQGSSSQGSSKGSASKGSDSSKQNGSGNETRSGARSRQAYISCVQQASDAAALEKCQALVPQR